MSNKNLKVERETYVKNGKEYFSYFVEGEARGIHMRAQVVPPDVGGYDVLDVVFAGALAADLVVKPYEMKSETGEVIKGNTYMVRSVDENGEIYECKIKPFNTSSKDKLDMFTR